MNETQFNRIKTIISSFLQSDQDMGGALTKSYVDEVVDETLVSMKKRNDRYEYQETDAKRLKMEMRNMFFIDVDDDLVILTNPNPEKWLDNKKSEIDWSHWNAYKAMLAKKAIPQKVVDANEKVIDAVLDYSSNPARQGSWKRKGLVMGNVQSGKTLNYLGLINKGIDAGYKVIILLGGHLVDLRKQTQIRVDEGVLGRESRHLVRARIGAGSRIGVGLEGTGNIDSGTTTLADFTKKASDVLCRDLNGPNSDPFIFTIKKHVGVMRELYEWIESYHSLSPSNGKKMDVPLLLIDDEADYASINTKHHKDEVTATNNGIRKLLKLFHKNTYVGYTATPFANIFIDPDENSYSEEDDLFPSDFMIKIPTPENYLGQNFFFPSSSAADENASIIDIGNLEDKGYEEIFELKKYDEISLLPNSLEQAVRLFILVVAIRHVRGERNAHNTMLVNVSHLKVHQDRLEFLIEEYRKKISDALTSFSGLGLEEANKDPLVKQLEKTFNHILSIEEKYTDIFPKLKDAAGKIKVWAINQGSNSDNKDLDYSAYKEHGLNAIVIGGHKLSRGLTLEGLSVSYFARNSKAYDTLMQMCRWFGYRPTYKDLCRVYIPKESSNWYAFISSAIRELYGELDLMSRSEKRPSDFGLKVREHPGAMIITAKNKIGAADSETHYQSLWGQVQRRFRFKVSKEINDRNLKYTEEFIHKLFNQAKNNVDAPKFEGAPHVFSNVDYSELIDFIDNIDLPEDDVGNNALIDHLNKMKKAGLPKAKVALFNQPNIGNTKWEEDNLTNKEQVFINKRYSFCGHEIVMPKRLMKLNKKDGLYEIPSTHLGNSDDEKIFLEDRVITQVKDFTRGKKKPVSFDYMLPEERDFPGLMIYLFAVCSKEPWNVLNEEGVQAKYKLGHGESPTVGFSVSIPRAEEIKGMTPSELKKYIKNTRHSYSSNKVRQRLKPILDYVESIEDE
jgi:hypothetical protein